MKYIKWFFNKINPRQLSKIQLAKMESRLLGKPFHNPDMTSLMQGICPDCNTKEKFLEGPHGGGCTNIMCSVCKSRFNVTPFGSIERI